MLLAKPVLGVRGLGPAIKIWDLKWKNQAKALKPEVASNGDLSQGLSDVMGNMNR